MGKLGVNVAWEGFGVFWPGKALFCFGMERFYFVLAWEGFTLFWPGLKALLRFGLGRL